MILKPDKTTITEPHHIWPTLTDEEWIRVIISYLLLVEYSRLDKGKRDTRQYTRVELHDAVCVLLLENGQVPVDGSKDCYKIEIHFSPGAKGGEEIITAGESFSCLGSTNLYTRTNHIYVSSDDIKETGFVYILPKNILKKLINSV